MPDHRRTSPVERHILQSLVERLKRIQTDDRSLVFRKRHGFPNSTAGDPDLYGLWKGVHFEIELKPVGENPALLQRARPREWEHAGALSFVHSPEELESPLCQVRLAQWRIEDESAAALRVG